MQNLIQELFCHKKIHRNETGESTSLSKKRSPRREFVQERCIYINITYYVLYHIYYLALSH